MAGMADYRHRVERGAALLVTTTDYDPQRRRHAAGGGRRRYGVDGNIKEAVSGEPMRQHRIKANRASPPDRCWQRSKVTNRPPIFCQRRA